MRRLPRGYTFNGGQILVEACRGNSRGDWYIWSNGTRVATFATRRALLAAWRRMERVSAGSAFLILRGLSLEEQDGA